MKNSILELSPHNLWKNFYELTQIPRPSKHEEQVQAFIINFAKMHKLKYIKDSVGNIIITKPATKGLENLKGVILQGHLDMVPQKNSNKDHDFANDPIETVIDGEWVTANGTTLGADNGTGVAAALAILESNNIKHGPLEVLFTADEETGMSGAFGLQANILKGSILLNLDSEDDDELCIGCAGGVDVNITVPYLKESVTTKKTAFNIEISGLKGGHSGIDIHLGRANSILLLFELIKKLNQKLDMDISHLKCGSLRNAIPREAIATLVIHDNDLNSFNSLFKDYSAEVLNKYSKVEPKLSISYHNSDVPSYTIDKESIEQITSSILSSPCGVVAMHHEIEDLVETSNNIASVISKNNNIEIQMLVRSSNDSKKNEIAETILSIFDHHSNIVNISNSYPGWKPNSHSEILNITKVIYSEQFDSLPKIKVIHAGLECGILSTNYPHWDMLSIGPNIRNPHSPGEAVNIQSVKKFWQLLTEILIKIPK